MASLSAKEVARELGVDARTFRKFMRSITPKSQQPGQGKRWVFHDEDIPMLRTKYDDWSAPQTSGAQLTSRGDAHENE